MSFVRRAIESVLAQEFKNYEVIVVDDGSTDGSGDLVAELFYSQIRLIRQENLGVSIARNKGIEQTRYPWIAFLDADDFWHPQYLEFMARTILENPSIGIIGAHYDSVRLSEYPELEYFPLKSYFKQAIRNTYFFTSATVIKKEFFQKKPGFDPKLRLGEDTDVWLRASLFFGDGLYVKNTLVFYGAEDGQRATRKMYLLEDTLIPKILDANYYQDSLGASSCSPVDFDAFKSKLIYLTLFPHYRDFSNEKSIRELLIKLDSRYFLVRFIYKLPFDVLYQLFSNRFFSMLFRKYMKFCFRYVYV